MKKKSSLELNPSGIMISLIFIVLGMATESIIPMYMLMFQFVLSMTELERLP